MTTADSRESIPGEVRIAGDMTIYQAAELKPTILDALSKVPLLEINLAGVTEIDTAGIQLLMLAKETARAMDKELRLVAHSEAVVDVLELVDLVPYFGDPLVISPSASNHGRTAGSSGEQSDGT